MILRQHQRKGQYQINGSFRVNSGKNNRFDYFFDQEKIS